MSAPKHLWRFPTAKAITSLAERFGLPNADLMQDWEWEVADPLRKDEFFHAYMHGGLSDDERFTIMETIIQSFEEDDVALESNRQWERVLTAIEDNLDLHIYTVWYWSDLENENIDDIWRVTPFLREILFKHRANYAQPGEVANSDSALVVPPSAPSE